MEAAKQDVKETKEVKAADDAVTDPIPDKTPHLVYGDKSLADEDAFVLLIFGDGFTASEQGFVLYQCSEYRGLFDGYFSLG